MRMGDFARALLGGTALLVFAGTAQGQTIANEANGLGAPGSIDRLEEIVVTARKRAESLQDVPVAVSVVSSAALTANLATDLSKLGELAPQVKVGEGGSGTGAVITIRGISSSSNDGGLDQSVAVEIDGVPVSRGRIISSALFDIAQVQVLQGPQALLFGKNSPAGVISLQSIDPTRSFEGYLRAGYEFEADEKYIEGTVSGPLSNTLAARFAFRARKMEGYIKNIAVPLVDPRNPAVTVPGANWGDRGPESEDYAGRLSLNWTPSDDLEVKLKLTANSQRQNSANANLEPFCINGQTQPVAFGTIPLPGADCRKDRVKAHSGVAPEYTVNFPGINGGVPYSRSRFVLGALSLEQQLDDVTLTSVTGYYRQTVRSMLTADTSPYAFIATASSEKYELVTEEVRATTEFDRPLNFMAGAYFETFTRGYFNASDINHVFNPVSQSYATLEKDTRNKGLYFSVFAQMRWNVTPELELSGGARYSYDEKSMSVVNLETGPSMPTLYPRGQVLASHYSDSHISPELTLTWHPQPDHTVFAAFKTGYKAGGISNPLILTRAATADNIKFDPERTSGFEAGYKATLLDGRLRFDIVGYRYNYNDLQVSSYNANTLTFTLQNAASARIQGVQASADWLITDGFTLRGDVGINRARYLRFPTAQCYQGQTAALGCVGGRQDLSGKSLVRAPKLTYSFGADYDFELSDWTTKVSVRASRSGSYFAASDLAPGSYQEAYWLLNASVRTGPADGTYELAIIGRNLTDSYYMNQTAGWSSSGNNNQYVGYFSRPREIAVQGTVRF